MDKKLLQAFLACGIPAAVAEKYVARVGARETAMDSCDPEYDELLHNLERAKYSVRKGKLHLICRGPIIGGFWGEIFTLFGVDVWTAEAVERALKENPNMDVVLHIDSPGGIIYDGARIRSMLNGRRANGHNVTAIIEGEATSMAAMITLAADKVLMDEYSLYQFHNPLVCMCGNARKLHQEARVMESWETIMCETIEARTGITAKKFLDQLAKDELVAFSAKEATENGLCNKILDGTDDDALADPAEDNEDDPPENPPDDPEKEKKDQPPENEPEGKKAEGKQSVEGEEDAGDKPDAKGKDDAGEKKPPEATGGTPASSSSDDDIENAEALAAIANTYPELSGNSEHSREQPPEDPAKETE